MSNLEMHARNELELAGLFSSDSDYSGMLGGAIMELIKKFADQGHSGASGGMTISAFEKLARFEPLMPLTGADDEWIKHGDGFFQNVRCPHVFKQDGKAYDSEGKIFREPDGSCFISSESHVEITFPYIPKREYVDQVDPDKEIAAIKARHAAMKTALERPKCAEFVIPEGVRPEQIGLRPLMCDSLGRLWDVSSNPIKRIFPPAESTPNDRTKGDVAGTP